MDDFATCCDRARVLARRGRFVEAEAAYRDALAQRPDALQVRLDLVVVLRRLRRTADAEIEARAALLQAPDSVAAHEALASVLFEQGRAAEAAEVFHTVLALRPDHVRARLQLAWALERSHDWSGAEAAARAVLSRIRLAGNTGIGLLMIDQELAGGSVPGMPESPTQAAEA